MPRKWDINGDEERLPEGVRRTGYDADTQTYTYEADDGSVYDGAPGQLYGRLTKTAESVRSRRTTTTTTSSSSSPSQCTTSTSPERGTPPSSPPRSRSGSPQTFSTILNNNKNNTPSSHPRRAASSSSSAAAARPYTPKSIPYHTTTAAASPTTTMGSSSSLRTHPTAKGAAKVLASDLKEYTREAAISVMLRMSKSIRKRTRAKRAANERGWVVEEKEGEEER
ncbi:uncharacterized protein B0T15DRAFT_491903 [Chaetomium strumarium]|uniref:Uncharacterized protein n=1 Tax=Chaetomium strumarium TaxID=1170767 RepID=A0AAJ0GUC6_9PEZI|nr:hypothetical protein B0T15DRAFT_491903 [Chaetomium strumarium]